MSSTKRGAVRSPNDFYLTNPSEIVRFIQFWRKIDTAAEDLWSVPRRILDPSAGGLTEEVTIEQKAPKPPLVFPPSEMSYPKAILEACETPHVIDTIDIRKNSRAENIGNFLGPGACGLPIDYDLVITNPPFSLALEFIRKALEVVKPGGYVVMLLRLNFFGSKERNRFFLDGNMPEATYVHARRLGFTPDGGTDSIEYMHGCWKKTDFPCYDTKLRVLPY